MNKLKLNNKHYYLHINNKLCNQIQEILDNILLIIKLQNYPIQINSYNNGNLVILFIYNKHRKKIQIVFEQYFFTLNSIRYHCYNEKIEILKGLTLSDSTRNINDIPKLLNQIYKIVSEDKYN